MQLGHGEGRISNMVFNSYVLTEAGEQHLQSPTLLMLPTIDHHSTSTIQVETKEANESMKQTRQSKGTHLLPVLTKLLCSSANWYNIESPEDYQYPGIFRVAYPQRLGYASDISALPFYTQKDEHFLFNDIQISKGKLRAPRKVKFVVDGKEEFLNYRIAPCGGIKCCSVEDCHYTISISEHRSCPDHAGAEVIVSKECPVEFVYVWPANSEDKRRWISGIIRVGDLKSDNLHNHDIHGPTKVPSKIVQDIQHAVKLDPTIKTHDLVTGAWTLVLCICACDEH